MHTIDAHALLLSCISTKQNTYNTCTHGTHTSCGKLKFTHYFTSQCAHTHCVPCMHACMHTNILEPNCLRSSLPQHYCMHSKINRVKISCLITCQYRQKHVDHAQLRMPADTLSSWYVPTYANTCPALDTCLHMQKHFTPLMHLLARYPAFDTCTHMHIYATCVHAQQLRHGIIWRTLCTQMHAATCKAKNANSCSSPQYKPKNAGTRSALLLKCVVICTPSVVLRGEELPLADWEKKWQNETKHYVLAWNRQRHNWRPVLPSTFSLLTMSSVQPLVPDEEITPSLLWMRAG